MSIRIREKDDKHFVGDLDVGKFFVHKGIVYMATEFSQRAIPDTSVVEIGSFGGETLPSKTRVRVVVMAEGIFE